MTRRVVIENSRPLTGPEMVFLPYDDAGICWEAALLHVEDWMGRGFAELLRDLREELEDEYAQKYTVGEDEDE